MTAAIDDICAMCKHFKMKNHPEHAKLGLGRCYGYDNTMAPLINPFVSWKKPACARFAQGDKITERMKWVEKQKAKQQEQKG